MVSIYNSASKRNTAPVIPLSRPQIVRERDGWGWFVIRGDHGWLCGDRRQAIVNFDQLVDIEHGRHST